MGTEGIRLHLQLENKETKEVHLETFTLDKDGESHKYKMDYVIKEKEWESYVTVECFNKRYNLRAWVVLKPSYYLSNEFDYGGELTDKNRAHDVVLAVGKTKFYLDKSYLSRWSRHFDRMFNGSFEGTDKSEIKLNEIDEKAFHNLLRYIHPCGSGVIDGGYEAREFIIMADRFDMPAVTLRCEQILVKDARELIEPSIDLLEFAAKYNLHQLEVACLRSIHSSPTLTSNFCEKYRLRIKKLPQRIIFNLI